MHRLVYNVFKAIALSIIFIFVWDIVFYMYRVQSLNSRIESLSTSLKKVVMENNYLPSEMATTYSEIFKNMICDFNNVPYTPGMSDAQLAGTGQAGQNVVNTSAFISGFKWNYGNPATDVHLGITASRQRYVGGSWQPQNVNIVKSDMSVPANYGDVMVVQLKVGVWQPIWGWTQANGQYRYQGEDVNSFIRNAASTQLVYTYYIPCLNFRTITNNS